MVYLLRHGLDDEAYIGGWSDVSLTDEGIMQVKDTIEYMKENDIYFNKIISSDITRAKQTALLVGDAFDIKPMFVNKLRELDKGYLTGLKKEEAKLKYPNYIDNVDIKKAYPHGESLKELYDRQVATLKWLLTLDDALIVTHRGPINMYYFYLTNTNLSNNKELFGVTHASLHELDKETKTLKRIYEPKKGR